MIIAEFSRLRASLRGNDDTCPALDLDSSDTLHRMEQILRADLRTLAVNHQVDSGSDAFGELLGRYRAWLGFLLLSRDALREQWSHELTLNVITDSTDDVPVPWFEPQSYEVTRLTCDSHHAADEQLARAALRQIQVARKLAHD
jgi:hypothetical protein